MRMSTRWTCRDSARYVFSLLLILMTVVGAYAQNAIKGVVKDDQGQGLPGVSVVVKGTTSGTVTDIEGNYTVNAPNDNSILIFSISAI